jgi:phage terminase large subunit GpA-like protein
MAIFDQPGMDHTLFAKSMISERLEHVPLPGKGYRSVWNVVDRGNNHYLDAAGYACAAASCLGVRIVPPDVRPQDKPAQKPRVVEQRQQQPHGRFKKREGGWVPKRGKR